MQRFVRYGFVGLNILLSGTALFGLYLLWSVQNPQFEQLYFFSVSVVTVLIAFFNILALEGRRFAGFSYSVAMAKILTFLILLICILTVGVILVPVQI
jgi:hypothetical protein